MRKPIKTMYDFLDEDTRNWGDKLCDSCVDHYAREIVNGDQLCCVCANMVRRQQQEN
jgi:hypothetical protein